MELRLSWRTTCCVYRPSWNDHKAIGEAEHTRAHPGAVGLGFLPYTTPVSLAHQIGGNKPWSGGDGR